MKYSIVTFGCRVNQADSLRIEEDLRGRGGVDGVRPPTPTLVVVNTCSVTATADQGARQTIRRIARDNPAAAIVVTGCYATRRPDELAALPNVVRVVRNDDKDDCSSTTRLTDRRALRRRRRAVRRPDRARRRRSDGVHAAGADRLRPATAATASSRRRAAPGAACRSRTSSSRGRPGRGVRVQGDRAHRRPPRVVRPRPDAGDVAARPAAARSSLPPRRHVPHQLARADGLHAGHRRARRRQRRPVRSAFPPAAAARERPRARARCAVRTRSTSTARSSIGSSTACRTPRSAAT